MRKEIHKKKVGELLHKIAEIEINLDIKKIEYKELEEEIKKLNERIRFLEECLDNKEKVNKSLREELEKLKNQN